MKNVSDAYLDQLDRPFRNPGVVKLQIGLGNTVYVTYTNNEILDSSLSLHASPVVEEIPQMTFSVTVNNEDLFWDYENPDSLINTMPRSTPCELFYGYQLDDGTEEIHSMGRFIVSDIKADENEAVIRGESPLGAARVNIRGMSQADPSERSLGVLLSAMRRSLWADGVLCKDNWYEIDVGVNEGMIGLVRLAKVNPAPLGEFLQGLAISTGCTLELDTNYLDSTSGEYCQTLRVRFRYDDVSFLVNGLDQEGIGIQTYKEVIPYLYPDFLPVHGGVAVVENPTAWEIDNWRRGYVSSEVSDSSGNFLGNPNVGIRLVSDFQPASYVVENLPRMISGVYLEFGNALPARFSIYTAVEPEDPNEDIEWVLRKEVSSGIDWHMTVSDLFEEPTTIEYLKLQFDQMAVPGTPATLDYIRVLQDPGVNDTGTRYYTIERNDMMSTPTVTRNKEIKEIRVPYMELSGPSDYVTFFDVDVDVLSLGAKEFRLEDSAATVTSYDASTKCLSFMSASQDVQWYITRVEVDGEAYTPTTYLGRYTFIDSRQITLDFRSVGTHHVTIGGYLYTESTGTVTYKMSDDGEILDIPLPCGVSSQIALMVARRLAEKYVAPLTYQVETRGTPELDPLDTVLFESKSAGNVPVMVTDIEVGFNGGYSGSITAQKWSK